MHFYISSNVALKPYNPCNLQHVDLGVDQLGAFLSTAHLTKLVAHLDTLVEVLAEGESSEEATCKHVSSTVGVDNLVGGEGSDGIGFWVLVIGLKVG